MDLDDNYFWSKNNRPVQSKNQDRNADAEHQLAHLKDKAGIMKTYHVWTGEDQYTNRYHEKMDRTSMSRDLTPFVMYSMNKRKNWEMEELDGVELMRQIQNLHKGDDVMFLERVAMRTRRWPGLFRYDFLWEDFKIHAMHELDTYVSGRPEYKRTVVNSVRRHHPSSFLEWSRAPDAEASRTSRETRLNNLEKEKRTVVVYHLIKSPDNYMTMFKKEFGRDNIYSCKWKPARYWKRQEMNLSRALDLRYEDHCDGVDNMFEDAELDTITEAENTSKRQFYNLEDHLLDNFVFVKKKKK